MAVKGLNYPNYFVDLNDPMNIIGFKDGELSINFDRFELNTPPIIIRGKIEKRDGEDIYIQDEYEQNGVTYGKTEFKIMNTSTKPKPRASARVASNRRTKRRPMPYAGNSGKSKRRKTKRRKMKRRKTRNKN